MCRRPPIRPPTRLQLHALWGLPGLVAQNPGEHFDGGIAEDSKWQAQWEKLVCMPTQRYDTPSVKVGNIFFGILYVELDGVFSRKWNMERVIVLQSVILQRSQGVNNSAQIRKRILFLLDCWNRGAFEELVKDAYNSDIGYLGKSRGNQTREQRHRNFSNLILKGKLREAVGFICDREKGVVFQPEKLAEDCTGAINDTVTSVLERKHPSKKIPSCATLETYEKTPILFPSTLQRKL